MGVRNILGMGLMYLSLTALNFIKLILAIVVIGLYAVDLDNARKAGSYVDSKWVSISPSTSTNTELTPSQAYVVAVGAISAVTALLYMVPFFLRFAAVWVWDVVVFILWVVAFGIFGSMYINEDPEGDADIRRMKNAVWVVLANMLLWLVGAIVMALYWFKHRERSSRFTGRAKV